MNVPGRPIVLLACSFEPIEVKGFGTLRHHVVFERYVDAATLMFDCAPLLLPASGNADSLEEYVAIADGAILTGAAANVAPEIYGGRLPEEDTKLDHRRDGTVLPFVRSAIAHGLPLLGICRGLQEINVACGGSLHQRIHEVQGRHDHRAPRDCKFEDRYLPMHQLHVTRGGWLEGVLNARGVSLEGLTVNSLHSQAIDELGNSVVVEAMASDGTVEAIRVADAYALTIGVQWHAEWYLQETPLHAAIFEEFGRACATRRTARLNQQGNASVK